MLALSLALLLNLPPLPQPVLLYPLQMQKPTMRRLPLLPTALQTAQMLHTQQHHSQQNRLRALILQQTSCPKIYHRS